LIENSDLIVLTHKIDSLPELIRNHPNKFIDLIGIEGNQKENYEGICW